MDALNTITMYRKRLIDRTGGWQLASGRRRWERRSGEDERGFPPGFCQLAPLESLPK
jgi:hypothetical protein